MAEPETIYTTLEHEDNAIRVLTFDPCCADSDLLRCQLRIVSLGSSNSEYRSFVAAREPSGPRLSQLQWKQHKRVPRGESQARSAPASDEYRFTWGDFAALSYHWGEQKSSQTVVVNDVRITVGLDLYQALEELAKDRTYEGRYGLWVDALCINQQDISERNEQVKKMGQIYGTAWHVISWLGPADEGADKALHLLRVIGEQCATVDENCAKQIMDARPSRVQLGSWIALNELFRREYWMRLWVMQEAVLGGSAVLFRAGYAVLDWAAFVEGLHVLHAKLWLYKDKARDEELALLHPSGARYRRWTTISLHLWKKNVAPFNASISQGTGARPSLSTLLTMAAKTTASDDRDKLYGLLAMMDDGLATRIQPRYDLTAPEAFSDAARAFYESRNDLELLRQCNCWGRTRSWAPDWTYKNRDNVSETIFGASGIQKTSFSFSIDGKTLRCQGAIVDTVDGIGSHRHDLFTYEPNTVISPQRNTSMYGDSANEIREAVARTLVGCSSEHLPPEYMRVLYLPAIFDRRLFQRLGWSRFLGEEGYYYTISDFHKFNADFRLAGRPLKGLLRRPIPSDCSEKTLDNLRARMISAAHHRRLATTRDGYFGWVPDNWYGSARDQTQRGDKVAIIFGCSSPIILRSHGYHYRVVGEALFTGLMDGEIDDLIKRGKAHAEDMDLK